MRSSNRSIAEGHLRKRGFADFFCELVSRRRGNVKYPPDLGAYFESPNEFFRLLNEAPNDFPYSDHIVPIHESNNDFFVCYVRPPP